MKIYLGEHPANYEVVHYLQLPPDRVDSKCWIIEQEIERREDERLDDILGLPPASQIAYGMSTAEAVHLEMFLRVRGAGSSDRSAFPSLEAEPRPNDLSLHFRSLIGSPRPRALLLGDRHHPDWDGSYKSAFGPWGGSGIYLLEALATDLWDDIAIANAYEEDLLALWKQLETPAVVALGRAPQRLCRELGIPCGVVPHPQYFRRFLYKRGLPAYCGLIREVMATQEDRGGWRG